MPAPDTYEYFYSPHSPEDDLTPGFGYFCVGHNIDNGGSGDQADTWFLLIDDDSAEDPPAYPHAQIYPVLGDWATRGGGYIVFRLKADPWIWLAFQIDADPTAIFITSNTFSEVGIHGLAPGASGNHLLAVVSSNHGVPIANPFSFGDPVIMSWSSGFPGPPDPPDPTPSVVPPPMVLQMLGLGKRS